MGFIFTQLRFNLRLFLSHFFSIRILVSVLLVCLPITTVHAATYYLDASAGDDNWTGTLSSPQAGDGPWKSLSKVNNAFLRPGDTVSFRCGEVWREPLVVSYSGDTGNPITYNSYGSCDDTNKPVIDGSRHIIPIDGWTLGADGNHSANLQAVMMAPANNLVTNGGYDVDASSWLYTEWRDSTACGDNSGGCMVLRIDSHTDQGGLDLIAGKNYRLSFRAKMSTSSSFPSVRVFDNDNTGDIFLDSGPLTTTTQWQSFSIPFPVNSSNTQITGKISFRIPSNIVGSEELFLDNVILQQESQDILSVQQLFLDDQYQELAHYPNRGYDPASPNRLYLAAKTSGTVASFAAGDDLVLSPTQEQDLSGAGIHIKDIAFRIDDCEVLAYDIPTKTFTNTQPDYIVTPEDNYYECRTANAVGVDDAYYLNNKLWMLDSAGEWYFDEPLQKLYLRPASGVPDNRVDASYQIYGIYALGRSNIVIDGLSIRKVYRGIELGQATNFIVQNTDVIDTESKAIVSFGGRYGTIANNIVLNSAGDGILLDDATNITIQNNSVSNTGTIGTPRFNIAGIRLVSGINENNNLVDKNTVINSGYLGIQINNMSTASKNYVENACLVLSDCGSIYTNGSTNNGFITDNTVINTIGTIENPAPQYTRSRGIYLDKNADNVTVTGNTVINTLYGFFLNDGTDNTFIKNVIYGSIEYPVYRSGKLGLNGQPPIYGNHFESNQFIPLNGDFTYLTRSDVDIGVDTYASIIGNRYSLLYSETLFSETINGANSSFSVNDFSGWKNQVENTATAFNPFAIALLNIISVDGINMVLNSDMETNIIGWGKSGDDYNLIDLEPETGGTCADGNCLRLTSTSSSASAYYADRDPRPSLVFGKYYRVIFDIRSGSGSQLMSVSAGEYQNGYNKRGQARYIAIEDDWQTQVFTFKATYDSFEDPSDPGASNYASPVSQLIFKIDPLKTIYLDNVKWEEVSVDINDTQDDTAIIANATGSTVVYQCDDVITDLSRCNEYVYFSDTAVVSWPVSVSPYSSKVIVWADNPFRDTDRDSILDSVDNCPINANPNQIDGNNDGVGDGCDVDSDGIADSDDNCPNSPNSDQLDTDADNAGNVCDSDDDNDGLADVIEDSNGNGMVDVGETDALNPDSDNDGLTDGDEVNIHFTNPLDFDSDDDGLTDGYEINIGLTDPNTSTMLLLGDFNGDGVVNVGDLILFQQQLLND